METMIKTMPRINLFIVGSDDYYYGMSVKDSLEKKFDNEVFINTFPDSDSCLHLMINSDEKPDIILLDYSEYNASDKRTGDHVMQYIQKRSPDSFIIILADQEHSTRAIKALGYGAHHFVMKDQFAHEEIFNAVVKCLYPSKI